MFANKFNFYGLILGIIISLLIVYVPTFNIAFGTWYQTTPHVFVIALGFGIVLFCYSVLRTYLLRMWNPVKYSKQVEGLDLHPTRWSTHQRN